MKFSNEDYYRKSIRPFDYFVLLFFVAAPNALASLCYGGFLQAVISNIGSVVAGQGVSNAVRKAANFLSLPSDVKSLLLMVLGLWLIHIILRFFSKAVLLTVLRRIFSSTNLQVTQGFTHLSTDTFLLYNPGYLKESAVSLDRYLSAILGLVFESMIPETFFIVYSCIQLYDVNKYAFFLMILWMALYMAVTALGMHLLKPYVNQQIETQRKRSGFFIELCNLPILSRFYNLADYLTNMATEKYNEPYLTAQKQFFTWENIFAFVKRLLSWLMIGMIGVFVLHRSLQTGQIRPVVFMTSFVSLIQMNTNVTHLATHILTLLEFIVRMGIACDFMSKNQQQSSAKDAIKISSVNTIAVYNLSIKHDTESNKKLLDNVTFAIHQGEKVAILGSSGSGKTTLCRAILGLVRPSEGIVCINGIKLSDVDADAYIEQIVYMPQQPIILGTTVAENIRLGNPNCSDARILQLIEQNHLPEGDTLVGDNGNKLSGGQRQRLSNARGQNKAGPGKLMICDEVTSGLDYHRKMATYHSLIDIAQKDKCTVLFVAHDREIVFLVDKIVYLDTSHEQTCVLFGTPKELASNSPAFCSAFLVTPASFDAQ
jgi:ABC-type bacteriocin/lantibiotic exporter with double-glycine peptidase domain